ncbi:MAG: c-type heme family protein [Planctomycetales bacterium]|jgi:hypothetical protein
MRFFTLRSTSSLVSCLVVGSLCFCLLTASSKGEPQESQSSKNTSDAKEEDGADNPQQVMPKLTVAEARRQSRLLHDTYVATLHTVHRQYFDKDERETIPARALEEVFRQVDAETGGKTRWISVNTPAMNIDHRPKAGFEKDAARQLSKGEREFERVEDGTYFRAGAVSLFAGCTKCHLSGLRPQQRVRSVAGLVMSVPVEQ